MAGRKGSDCNIKINPPHSGSGWKIGLAKALHQNKAIQKKEVCNILRHYVYIVGTASMTRAILKKRKLKKYYNMLLKRRTKTNDKYLEKY